MRALPALPGRTVIAMLERAGFEVIRTRGSHHFLRHIDVVAITWRNSLMKETARPLQGAKRSIVTLKVRSKQQLRTHLG